MKLGLLTAPFPETPLMEVADWAARRVREPRDRLLAALDRPDPPVRRDEPHRRRRPDARQGREIVDEIAGKGLSISGLGYYPNPLHRTSSTGPW